MNATVGTEDCIVAILVVVVIYVCLSSYVKLYAKQYFVDVCTKDECIVCGNEQLLLGVIVLVWLNERT